MSSTFRLLTSDDEAIVWQMLMYAAHEDSLASTKANLDLNGYAADWGKEGDMGLVAMSESQHPEPVGAVWIRFRPDKGFGYIDDAVPELAIAVLPSYQGQGIGTRLLTDIVEMARHHVPAMSLSCRMDNQALQLYLRCGFSVVESSTVTNRVGGKSVTMVYRF